ncbi:MAG: hypothetical protein ACW979_10495 [Candidatus Thorarchaeota archaeon]
MKFLFLVVFEQFFPEFPLFLNLDMIRERMNNGISNVGSEEYIGPNLTENRLEVLKV